MANWSTLKAAIANIIKTNGNQAITGQLLQNVLNNIVSSVGENATFAGIAIPTTNPGAPDGPVFYLATTTGNYSNFGGIELAEGEAVILQWNNGAWSKKTSGFATQQHLTKLGTKIDIVGVEPSTSLRIDADNLGNVTLGSSFGSSYYIEATLPNGTSVVWFAEEDNRNYNIPNRGKLLWNLKTNVIRTITNREKVLDEEIILLSRNVVNISGNKNSSFTNMLKGYVGGLLLPYITNQIIERGSVWSCITDCEISFGGDGVVKISKGLCLFYKYDGTSTLHNAPTPTVYDLHPYKQLVFNYYDNEFRVAKEYEELNDKEILLLRYSDKVNSKNNLNKTSVFGYTDGLWIQRVQNEARISENALIYPSLSCELKVNVEGKVILDNRVVNTPNSWYGIALDNGKRHQVFITDDNNTHNVPDLGALVYNRWDNTIRTITLTSNGNNLGSHDIILLKRVNVNINPTYAANSIYGFTEGKLYHFLLRSVVLSGNAYQCVSTAKINADNQGNVNIGKGQHIFYRYDGTYRVLNAENESYVVPAYGKLVWNYNSNHIKVVEEYDDLSEYDILLLKRGNIDSVDTINSWVGGLWFNKLLTNGTAGISGIWQQIASINTEINDSQEQIASINTEINDLQEQIASISPTVGFADLPVSDGSNIQVGYAYINSSDNTIRVKR